jgi:hypothetical protein
MRVLCSLAVLALASLILTPIHVASITLNISVSWDSGWIGARRAHEM